MKTKGFTLIELLVVIAIISLLMSVIIPALRGAREVARAVICLNQMRQIGVAITTYTSSNRENYPQTISGNPTRGAWPGGSGALSDLSDEEALATVARYATWWGLIAPSTGLDSKDMASMDRLREASVGTIGNCPTHGAGYTDPTVGGSDSFSYAGNGNFFVNWTKLKGFTPQRVPPVKTTSVRSRGSKILVFELHHSADWPLAFVPLSRRGAPHQELIGTVGTQHGWNGDGELENAGWGPTHRQNLNYLFADGSVEAINHMVEMRGGPYEEP